MFSVGPSLPCVAFLLVQLSALCQIWGVKSGHLAVAQYLIEQGADLEVRALASPGPLLWGGGGAFDNWSHSPLRVQDSAECARSTSLATVPKKM
jgi:hypothetical protein